MKWESSKLVSRLCAAIAAVTIAGGNVLAQTANTTGTTTLPPLPASLRTDNTTYTPPPANPALVEQILSPLGCPALRGAAPTATTTAPTAISLQGSVTRQAVPAASLSATIDQEVKRKFKGPPSKFLAVTLHLNNPTGSSLILDGDQAMAYYGDGSRAQNVSEQQAVADADNTLGMTNKQKVAVAAVTLATATLGGQLFYEWIQGGASNPKLSLGIDEIRRRIEGVRLGDRLMLPNEQADGTVFLPEAAGMPSYITIPVLTYPTRQPAGALRVDIGAMTAAGATK
jgi:hypothetical protein